MKGLGVINLMSLEFHNGEDIIWRLDRNHSAAGRHYMTSNDRHTLLKDWYSGFVSVRDVVSPEEVNCLWDDPYPCEEDELRDVEDLL